MGDELSPETIISVLEKAEDLSKKVKDRKPGNDIALDNLLVILSTANVEIPQEKEVDAVMHMEKILDNLKGCYEKVPSSKNIAVAVCAYYFAKVGTAMDENRLACLTEAWAKMSKYNVTQKELDVYLEKINTQEKEEVKTKKEKRDVAYR